MSHLPVSVDNRHCASDLRVPPGTELATLTVREPLSSVAGLTRLTLVRLEATCPDDIEPGKFFQV